MNLPKDRFYDLAKDALKKLTLDEKLGLLSTHQHRTESIGLDEFFIGHEVARGFVGRGEDQYSTVFPQPVGLAGTFDTELMEEIGEIAGNECRAYTIRIKRRLWWGPPSTWSGPTLGRTEEAYGEDVFLAGQMMQPIPVHGRRKMDTIRRSHTEALLCKQQHITVGAMHTFPQD